MFVDVASVRSFEKVMLFDKCFTSKYFFAGNCNKKDYYSQDLLIRSLQNISAPIGLIKKLRPLYYVDRPFRFY